MNKFIFTLFIMVYAFTAEAQWENEYNLTGGLSAPYLNKSCMAASGNYIFVAWEDFRDGNSEIYYKRSTDSGLNWGADTRLTTDPAVSGAPTVAALGTFVHITWVDFRNGNPEIYYKRSTDYGANWEAVVRLTNDPASSLFPVLSASGNDLHIAWVDERNGNPEIYYKRSTNKGVSWEADFRLTQDALISEYVRICSSGLFVYTVWVDNRDGNNEIYYKRSTNGGASWDGVSRLTNDPDASYNPDISVTGANVHIVWVEYLGGSREIYYKRSTDGGATWNNSFTRLTNDQEESKVPSICVTGSALHVVWSDKRLGTPELFYRRNSTGNPVGITGITSEIPSEFSLSQNYPNPFNPVTNINFSIPKTGMVKLTVYDASGREAAVLFNGELSAGTYNYDFNASQLASGIYFYKLEANSFTRTKKMVLVK